MSLNTSKDDGVQHILSCDQCKHTTETVNKKPEHTKKEHNIEQLAVNISLGIDKSEVPLSACHQGDKDEIRHGIWHTLYTDRKFLKIFYPQNIV